MLIPQAHQAVAAALLPRAWQSPLRPAAGPSALSGSGMNVPSSFLWASLPHKPPAPTSPPGCGPPSPTSHTPSASGRPAWARGHLDNHRSGSPRWLRLWAPVFLSPSMFDVLFPQSIPDQEQLLVGSEVSQRDFSNSRVGGSAAVGVGGDVHSFDAPFLHLLDFLPNILSCGIQRQFNCKALKEHRRRAHYPPSPTLARSAGPAS